MLLPGVGVAMDSSGAGGGGAGVETTIWSEDEVDLKTAGEVALVLPPGAAIGFIDEVGIVCTKRSGAITGEASMTWGVHGNLAKYHGEESLDGLTAANTTRVKFDTTLADAGETAPAVNVSIAATGAGTLKGRPYMKVTILP